ncbi:hypothetical protein [Burkholderia gladioli]|uniref:hypothetical protein n=1 Tax=Burkholderia gladioli TaxID=28095 RepID=UPI0034DB5D2D
MSEMNDKREYADMMKIMDAEASISSTLNKLGQVSIDTEDETLKSAATGLASQLRTLAGPNPRGKARLLTIGSANKESPDAQRRQFAKLVLQVWDYCKDMREKQEPRWQILAKRAGWTPPASQ